MVLGFELGALCSSSNFKNNCNWALVAHICNPSYFGGWD
jgi:hypothetical protein